ncbi:MAG: recombination protein RecR [Candidatus Sungbacteria bacterium]|nr:recombination protein RecR [Candidatus Sungbacteria bacterium]
MLSKPIQKLADLFLKFPGVGPKQAARFVFYLLREDRGVSKALAEAVASLHDEVKICVQCFKTYDNNHVGGEAMGGLCELCRGGRRNPRMVMVVEKEVDLVNIERTRKFDGLYHVLGGTIDPLDSAVPARLHLRELFERVRLLAADGPEIEIILATNPTAEGNATALYLERVFSPLKNKHSTLKISRLGRGISTGAELEYSDEITIANALENRK